jgi:hypothetical protein
VPRYCNGKKGDLHRLNAKEKIMGSTGRVLRKSLAVFVVTSMICVTALGQHTYRGAFGNGAYALFPTSLLFNSSLTSTYEVSAYVDSLAASANKSFRYGADVDGVTFAQAPSGVRGRFVRWTPDYTHFQFDRGGESAR